MVAAQGVADCPQHDIGEPQSVAQACLQADQHLHDHELGQCPQVHLPGVRPLPIPLSTRIVRRCSDRCAGLPTTADSGCRGGKLVAGGDLSMVMQPGETSMADVRVIVVGGCGALIDPAYLAAEEAVLGKQEQDPCGWIPSGLGHSSLSSARASTAAGPSRPTPASTCGNSIASRPLPAAARSTAAAVTGVPRRSRGDWAPRRREESGCT